MQLEQVIQVKNYNEIYQDSLIDSMLTKKGTLRKNGWVKITSNGEITWYPNKKLAQQ